MFGTADKGSAWESAPADDDVEQLFTGQTSTAVASSVPVSTSYQQPLSPTPPGTASPPLSNSPLNTLDEPVWATIKRDLLRVWHNLVLVVFPFKSRDQQHVALRNWDLWGPMIFTLVLAITLSVGTASASHVFSIVFAVVSFGAVVLTVNVELLGGSIAFFQSLCLLGYCLFPIDVAGLVCALVNNLIVRWVLVAMALVWSSWASVPFIGGSVPPARRMLAVFPTVLLYTTLCWLTLVAA